MESLNGEFVTVSEAELIRWAEALAGVARTGLGFTQSQFEAERYTEILAIAADIRARTTEPDRSEWYQDQWLKSVNAGVAGYATPKVAVGAIVGDDQGRLLLIQRMDSKSWLYPTGWADVGYSPAEVAVKEVREETGIRVEVVRPVAIIDGMRAGFSRIPLYSLVFHCRATGGTLAPHPQECLDAGWFSRSQLPEPLARGDWVDMAFAVIDPARQDQGDWQFDPPRAQVWDSPVSQVLL